MSSVRDTPSVISAAAGSGVGSGVAVGSGVGVGVGSGCAGAPQAARSAQSSANIRKREARFFVADILSPAICGGTFADTVN